MKSSDNYFIRVLATGFIVLTSLSIPLFWFRSLCRINLYVRMSGDIKNVVIEPSGFLAEKIEDDPNLARKSRITTVMYPERLLGRLGMADYVASVSPGGRRSNVFFAQSDENWAYFDKVSGQIIYRYDEAEIMPDKNRLHREVQYHIGPEGVSEIPDASLGRFIDPVIDRSWSTYRHKLGLRDLILFDTKLKRFFRIDFNKTTVVKGPELNNTEENEPVQIGLLDKNPFLLDLSWLPPAMKISTGYRIGHGREYEPIIQTASYSDNCPYLFVLDKGGAITLLDKETLEFAGPAGHLPETQTLFGPDPRTSPLNILSYNVQPVFLGAFRSPEEMQSLAAQKPDNVPLRYAGMIVASVSRDGTDMAVSAYDEKGQKKNQSYRVYRKRRDEAREMAYFGNPWAPASTIGKFLVENLHPPILSLASYFTASTFEAGSGYKALFLLPNSFMAMKGRDSEENIVVRFLTSLLIITPSILLAFWLACQVVKEAAVIGLSRKTRRWWILGTIAFGLPAYITYKLTKPKITLVTCPNCGKPRRPDMDTCHRCNSPWHIPELTPPTWRVLNGTEQNPHNSLAETNASE